MIFTEKSLTQPGMAFSAKAIIKRSQNGTLPAIYQNGSYELSEDNKGYIHQEKDDVFVDDYPQLEDVVAFREKSRDYETEFRNSVAEFVKSSREKVSDVATSSNLQRDFDEGEVDVAAARTATPLSEAQQNASGVRRAAVNVP